MPVAAAKPMAVANAVAVAREVALDRRRWATFERRRDIFIAAIGEGMGSASPTG
ncbi:MAG: hypothetical protein ACYTE2_05120 [Planctomycetota bacterium]